MNDEIPETHPRYKSLVIRERLRDFMEKGIVVPEGLIAHGRGEAFDYIFGEASQDFALESEKAAISLLMLSKNPVITVNGNVAALSYKEIVELHNVTGIKVEINLFHRSDERIKKIAELFQREGLTEIYGIHADKEIPGLVHNRRFADGNGIYSADTVFIPLEDGDRAMSLKNMGKKVIAIDLNPFSRTSITADISIIDEITRTIKNFIKIYEELKNLNESELKEILNKFDNKKNKVDAINLICEKLRYWQTDQKPHL